MPTKDQLLYEAVQDIKYLKEREKENANEISILKLRCAAYDKMAAKWGGICMLAIAIGGFVLSYSEKIGKFLISFTKP